MEQKQIIKTHRVGTITFGSLLIIFGVLFLIHLFFPALNYSMIFRLWPCIFIFLGIEVLASNRKVSRLEKQGEGSEVNFIYDKAAIFLMICLFFFAMIMAIADFCMVYNDFYIRF